MPSTQMHHREWCNISVTRYSIPTLIKLPTTLKCWEALISMFQLDNLQTVCLCAWVCDIIVQVCEPSAGLSCLLVSLCKQVCYWNVQTAATKVRHYPSMLPYAYVTQSRGSKILPKAQALSNACQETLQAHVWCGHITQIHANDY